MDQAVHEIAGTHVRVVVGDLTRLEVDAVVNAANVHLRHGGGVAGALARAGGPTIQQESDAWVDEHGPLVPGQAAVTTAGDLPARLVVHVAGPVHGRGDPDDETHLRSAVRAALVAAVEHGARSVALPAISSGIYGYPLDEATGLIAAEVVDRARALDLDEVLLVGIDTRTAEAFAAGLATAAGTTDPPGS